jgi:hypothetical protein
MRNNGEGFDVDAILAAINDNTRLVFLANPNNPTGTLIDAATVDAFLAKVPDHVVVVLDEAYYEFALYFAKLRQCEYSRSLEHLRSGPGRTSGILRAHAQYFLRFFSGGVSGSGRARRPQSHRKNRLQQRLSS